MKTKKIPLQTQLKSALRELKAIQEDLRYARIEARLVRTELDTIKKYTLNPVVSLQIALEKTVECVAHTLTDMKGIQQYQDAMSARKERR